MQNNNPIGNPNKPPGGYGPPSQGQLHQQQQPGMGYYGQPGPGQPPQQPQMSMPGQQIMMSGGSSGMSMNYQSSVPQMMQQQPVQPTPAPSMMQQAMFGAQGALATASRPYSGPGTNATTGFTTSSSSMSMPMGGVAPASQGPQSFTAQSATQQQPMQQQPQPSQQATAGFAGQQPQQSAAPSSQQGYAYSHGTAAAAPAMTASSGSTASSTNVHAAPSTSHSSVPKSETKRPLNPPPYSPQILEHLDRFSVGTLTVIGRELVSELTTRTHSLCMSLKAVSERKPPAAGDPEQLLEYCQMLMDKLVEIRLRIEKKVGKRRLNTTEYIKLMSDMSPPVDDAPPELKEKREQFEENRMKICTLNNDLKMLDWMASVTDPSLLKKVDKMATSTRERE